VQLSRRRGEHHHTVFDVNTIVGSGLTNVILDAAAAALSAHFRAHPLVLPADIVTSTAREPHFPVRTHRLGSDFSWRYTQISWRRYAKISWRRYAKISWRRYAKIGWRYAKI